MRYRRIPLPEEAMAERIYLRAGTSWACTEFKEEPQKKKELLVEDVHLYDVLIVHIDYTYMND